jgi:hypothetical protein
MWSPPPKCPPPGCPPPQCPPPKIPDTLDDAALTSVISGRLGGTPADGSAPPTTPPDKAIWVDRGDEVLVHLDSLKTRTLDRMLLVSVDLETDQTGRTTMVVPLALGNATDPAGLVGVTDQYPRGNGLLASRWGEAVQAAVWSTVLGIARDHASERGAAPLGISASAGAIKLHAGPALSVASLGQIGVKP